MKLWWLVGALMIGLALPLAAIMLAADHRRHRHWPSTVLALTWSLLAASVVGVSGGNLSPPLFGVPLVLLYAAAWAKKPTLAAAGVTMSYLIALLVLLGVFRDSSEIRWAFVVAWVASAVALVIWRTRRPAPAVS